MNQIEIVPDIGVPLPSDYSYADLKQRVEAACNTIAYLVEQGADMGELTQDDMEAAASLAAQCAASSESEKKAPTDAQLSALTPAAIALAAGILNEYSHRVVDSAVQIRNFVTTKLILESENPDPKIRIRALQMLGNISDVGLFTEKTEVTVTHRTSDELKEQLRAKLERLINPAPKPPALQRTSNPVIEDAVILEEDDEALDFSNLDEIDTSTAPLGAKAPRGFVLND